LTKSAVGSNFLYKGFTQLVQTQAGYWQTTTPWIGWIGTALYGVVFYQAKLYAEVGLQGLYLITSLQALYIWLRGGQNHTEKPVGHVSRKWLILTIVLAIASVVALRSFLIAIRGTVPF
jgi:nicotinamide mononucleotide transporter